MDDVKLKSISHALDEATVNYLGSIVSAPTGEYFVNIPIQRKSGRQSPNNLKLKRIKDALQSEDITVHFLLHDENNKDIEAGYRATILHAFEKKLKNAFISFVNNKSINIWLEQKYALLEADDLAKIETRSKEYFEPFELSIHSISSLSNANVPSKLALINTIRIHSPISTDLIMQQLEKKGFEVPSPQWLNKRLDSLRKSDNILRLNNGSYALTSKSIKILGTNTSRNSHDIQRFLALARG